ncbi:Endo-1,3(4)-beta-glucanase [Phytophthora palmivora]|uniref:Endo-1,3(4)-beta-glucanase n=1 Tax=Phytophthora palmivora TaxID=4796 RepID=A0A2P4YBB1_9STRA|nr:Endo-1,3(4)-beta-glucanase [Phytophthora palmivora]
MIVVDAATEIHTRGGDSVLFNVGSIIVSSFSKQPQSYLPPSDTATRTKEENVTMKNSNNTWLSLLLVKAATLNPMESMHKLKDTSMGDGLSRSWVLYNAATR